MIAKLQQIQSKLKAPKSQFNAFGKYNYRSCEDILEAVKPLLAECGAAITITDKVVMLGNHFYVEATATFMVEDKALCVTAFAREAEEKKGMDAAQVTGAASSYARKYALNGLLLIDDTKDSDATNKHGKEAEGAQPLTAAELIKRIEAAQALPELENIAKKYKADYDFMTPEEQVKVKTAKDRRKTAIKEALNGNN